MLCLYTAFRHSRVAAALATGLLVPAGGCITTRVRSRAPRPGCAQVRLGGARGGAVDRRRHRARAVVRRPLPRRRARRRLACGGQCGRRDARRPRRRAAGRARRWRRAARAPVPRRGPAGVLRGAARPVDGERRRCAPPRRVPLGFTGQAPVLASAHLAQRSQPGTVGCALGGMAARIPCEYRAHAELLALSALS